jgi:hypothetical protein
MFNRQSLLLALLLVAFAAGGEAQTISGTIVRQVSDSSGAAVPAASIRIVNVNANSERLAVSDSLVNYEAAHLPPGQYRVEVEHQGFQKLVRENVELQTRAVVRVDLQLVVGDVATTVNVSGEVALVESETARIADVRSGDLIRTLPLNSISIFRFTVLTPGVLGNVTGSTRSGWTSEVHRAGSPGGRAAEDDPLRALCLLLTLVSKLLYTRYYLFDRRAKSYNNRGTFRIRFPDWTAQRSSPRFARRNSGR